MCFGWSIGQPVTREGRGGDEAGTHAGHAGHVEGRKREWPADWGAGSADHRRVG